MIRVFTKKIESNNDQHLKLYLYPINTKKGIRIFIEAVDMNLEVYNFAMKELNGSWRIINESNTPQRILDLEAKINSEIYQSII
jgi:predicted GH43/DUF377 family glycosyl hydrolase